MDQIEADAAAWDARLRRGDATERERIAFQAWLLEAEEHRHAHERLQAALFALRAQADLPELSALRDAARQSARRMDRWRFAFGACAAAALVLAVGLAFNINRGAEAWAVLHGAKIYATTLNERTQIVLADGSAVTLDSNTRLAARLSPDRRDITLLSGRALFHVAKDRQRPFVVRARDRTVTALGTVFDVGLSPRSLRVTLLEGRVAVRSVQAGGVSRELAPRQEFVERDRASAVVRIVDPDKALGWVDGQIFFENDTLAQAADEMNQYSRLKIVVDPAIADLKINGMFRAGNQTGFVGALQTTMPVEVRPDEHGQLLVTRRPSAVRDAAIVGDASEQ
ncbi:FecR domain-containing protein [Caulobacter sp. FWC26]|uniref:FecR family protein n=1 Tax=Caulobacter sp. FWC26 TaxID=69665 RepID=UPI00143CDC50|nr:FecR domain-containing protein [Caulobacter sp. FWC26]